MKALKNISRLQVSTDMLLMLLKVYEDKGKSYYFDELFERDKDVFKKKVIEKNTFYLSKIMGLTITDARLKQLSKKKLSPKNKTEVLILNLKSALTSIQKNPKEFEVIVNEFDELARMLSKDYEIIKFGSTEIKQDGTLFTTEKKLGKREVLEQIILEYNRQTKTKLYELTQLISNFYLDFLQSKIFTSNNELITFIILYAFMLKDFSVFKYVSFFESLHSKIDNYKLSIDQAVYYYNTGYPNTDMFNKLLIEILTESYVSVENFSKEYTFEIKLNKSDSIEATVKTGPEIFSKDDIKSKHPTVSVITIDRTLKRLKEEGIIQPLGKGRSSKWQRISDDKRRGGQQLDIFQLNLF